MAVPMTPELSRALAAMVNLGTLSPTERMTLKMQVNDWPDRLDEDGHAVVSKALGSLTPEQGRLITNSFR